MRDLFRNTNNPNRSYSERVIFEKALQRLVAEIAVVNGMTDTETEEKVLDILSKYHETYQDTVSEEFVEVDEEFDSEPEQLPQGI